MSKKGKFNGFERWFINTAIIAAVKESEEALVLAEETGKRPIYSKGYFTMISKELMAKVDAMTLKEDI